MSTIGFARAAQRWTSRICVHDLFTFQGVTPSSKTRNQLIQCTTSWPAHRVAHPKAVRQDVAPHSPRTAGLRIPMTDLS